MKLTKETYKLMSFFVDNNCVMPVQQTQQTDTLITRLYNDIVEAYNYIQGLKSKNINKFYKLTVERITNVKQIPRPTTFASNSFPSGIRQHIDDNMLSVLTYSFHLFGRKINILFLTEDFNMEPMYNEYVDYMLMWLYIVNQYASKSCSTELTIFVYHTTLLKLLPPSNVEVLDEIHVNTAFTRTCPTKSEIVVFRKEEWFKVFIHETFHNFGLDFSDLNTNEVTARLLSIFPVQSEVNLYECYSEFWARIMNTLFCSFINIKNKNNIDEFLTNVEFFINFERIYAFFQLVKVLNFMEISYYNLYSKTRIADHIRKTMYKENTSVLSYYVLTTILLNNYQDFLVWCNKNNTSLLQFKKTTTNMDEFCAFIEKKYKAKSMLDGIACTERLLNKTKRILSQKTRSKELGYLLKNMRMTICELG
jgi:hypothetical protein